MVNMMESSLAESMVSNTTNMYDPMVSILSSSLRYTVSVFVPFLCRWIWQFHSYETDLHLPFRHLA